MARGLLLASIGTALVVGATAAGAPTWGAPLQISSGDRALGPELALNEAGEALVVWDQEVGSECPESPASLSCIHIVEAATRSRGSTVWQTPVDISRPGVGATPRAAIDAAGDAAILWVHDIGRDRVLQATYRKGSSGTWPEPSDLSEPSLGVRNHQAALDSTGNVVAVWSEGASGAVQAAFRSAATGVWGAPVSLSSSEFGSSRGPSLALTPSGKAVVAWVERFSLVRVASGDAATGTWTQKLDLSQSVAGVGGDPQIAINPAEDAAVVWIQQPTGSDLPEVEVAFRPHGRGWSAPFSLRPRQGAPAEKPQVAVDGAGNVVVTWLSLGVVEAAVRSYATGRWDGPVVVAAPVPRATDARLTIDEFGNAVAVWVSGENGIVQAAIRPGASDEWQPPINVSTSGAWDPRVAMDAAGNAVAIWNRSSSQRVVVESADLVGSGPVLANLRVPKKGTARVHLTFSVKPVPWAAPIAGTPRWLFGDGGSATGARVTHVYRRPGRYRVKVTSIDTLGNATIAARAVRIGRT